MKLTQQIVDGLKLPKGKSDHIEFDDNLPRFGVRLREGGSRKYVVHYRLGGKQHRITIGSAAVMKLVEAHQRARKILVAVDDGADPVATKAEQKTALALRFADVVKDYLEAAAKVQKPRTFSETERYLQGSYWAEFHKLALTSVTKAMVATEARRIARESGDATSDRAKTKLSALYGWAIGEGLTTDNPVIGTNAAAKARSRERVLTDPELACVYQRAPDGHYGAILRLCALTAQRREEIGGLRWDELTDLDGGGALIELPGERTKNGLPHIVPLAPQAVAILRNVPRVSGRVHVFGRSEDSGFRGWAYGKAAIDETSGVEDWVLHDLRRTAATRMAGLGVLPHVIEAVLNHVSGHKAGIAGIYNRWTYAAEKREALTTWGQFIHGLVQNSTNTT